MTQQATFDLLALMHDDGPFVVARKRRAGKTGRAKKGGWLSIRVANAAEARKLLLEENQNKADVYVRHATFGPKNDEHGNPVCDLANIQGNRTIAIDVDGDGKPGHYPDLPTAWAAIMDTLRASVAIHLPAPNLIILSGHGYHVAWVLDTQLPLDVWQRYHDALYGWLHGTGLLFDPGGGNAHLALRFAMPGADIYNWKDPRNPVKTGLVYGNQTRIPAPLFQQALDPFLVSYGPTKPKIGIAVDNTVEQEFGASPEGLPFDLAEIQPHCAQIHVAATTGGRDSRYPFWINTLQMARRHQGTDPDREADGLAWAHAFSYAHPGYDPAETESKFRSFRPDGGIIRCKTLRKNSSDPSLCEGCPFWSDPKGEGEGSPAKIPHELVRQQYAAMRLPHPAFTNGEHGLEQTVQGENGQTEQRLILKGYHITKVELHEPAEHDTVPAQLVFQLSIVGQSGLAGGWSRQMILTATECGEVNALQRATAKQGLVLVRNEAHGMQGALKAWMQRLREEQQTRHAYSRLGWSRDKKEFILGNAVFREDGSQQEIAIGTERAAYIARGQDSAWTRIFTLVMQGEARPEAHALIATAFGAPLLDLTGVGGVVVNFHSPASGVGKTILAKLAASVWGYWRGLHQTVDDTPGSLQRRLAIANHLPSYFDEARPAERREFFNTLVFRIGQGQEKKRLTSDIKLQEAGEWATFLVTCTNFSLSGVLGGKNAQGDAAQARVVDFEVPQLKLVSGGPSIAQVQQEIDQLGQHHGWIGRTFAAYIVQQRASIARHLQQVADILLQQVQITPNDAAGRYQAAAGACMIVGAEIVQQLGLLPELDPGLVVDAVKQALAKARAVRLELQAQAGVDDVLREFLKAHQPSALITMRDQNGKKVVHSSQRDFRPKLPLLYEIDTDAKEIVLDQMAFQDWARERGLDPQALAHEIWHTKKYPYAVRELAKGVQPGGRLKVIVLPADQHQPFGDFMP